MSVLSACACNGATYSLYQALAEVPRGKAIRAGNSACSSCDAAVVSLSRNKFTNDLEKHLNDYKKGKGYLSKTFANRLGGIAHKNGLGLNEIDPKAASQYNAVRSALGYKASARFVSGVERAIAAYHYITK